MTDNNQIAPEQVQEIQVYAGYRQFYLMDKNPAGATDANDFWTDEAFRRMLAINPGIIGVGTGSYGFVPVRIEIWSTPPDESYDVWDHITESSLDLNGGELIVAGCPDMDYPLLRVTVNPGTYRVRVYAGNLDSVPVGEDEGEDYYRIVLWPGNYDDPIVLKQWWSRDR